MSYKTILVHMADVAKQQNLLAAVLPLARQYNAHLIGLCVLPPNPG